MAAAGNYSIDCEREANLLPLSFRATSVFLPSIQTGIMWWRIWLRKQFPNLLWKWFLPLYRTNPACIQSAGRAFPKALKLTPWEHSGLILHILYRLDGNFEEKQSMCKNIRLNYKVPKVCIDLGMSFLYSGYIMLDQLAADHIFIHFQTALSQKHIITCHNIYNPALVKNGQYSFF